MNKTIKILISICIVILIVLIGVICYNLFENKKQNEIKNITYNQTKRNQVNENISANKIDENTIKENIIEENTNEISENIENNLSVVESEVVGREEQESINQDKGQTDEEKVITLAKNKWGANDKSVTFVIENRDGDVYNVAVRSNETTAAVAWYSVNIVTGEVKQ